MIGLNPKEAKALTRLTADREKLNEYFLMVGKGFLMVGKGFFGVIEFYQDRAGGHVRGVNQDGSDNLLLTLKYNYAIKQFEIRAGLDIDLPKRQTGEFRYGPHDKQVCINICSRPNRFGGKDITLTL